MSDELTPWEKISLIAHIDDRHRGEFDPNFLDALKAVREPPIIALDDRKRRSLALYIEEMEARLSKRYTPGGFLIVGWILGYEAARTIPQSIYKEGREPTQP